MIITLLMRLFHRYLLKLDLRADYHYYRIDSMCCYAVWIVMKRGPDEIRTMWTGDMVSNINKLY